MAKLGLRFCLAEVCLSFQDNMLYSDGVFENLDPLLLYLKVSLFPFHLENVNHLGKI